ncbi:MAG: flagellar export chaperone FliS [Thermodesulfobacteriota bacterium]|nr:flagellar export chaperone FliS [Thermodesulfobacteriota bacterium]
MYSEGFHSYRKTNVITADPKRLILMCYEGAIDNLKIAKMRYVEKDYEGKGKALIKAQDIINELLCSLDLEKGGAIARNLDSLYNYMLRKIIHADVNRTMDTIDEIIGMLDELKSAWEEAFYKQARDIQPEASRFYEGGKEQVMDFIGV